MGKQGSVDDRISRLSALSEKQYEKGALLPEYLKLQEQMVDLVFGDLETKTDLRMGDVFREVERRNNAAGEIATEEIKRFSRSSREFDNLIKAELSGIKGENLVARELYKLRMSNKILRNVEIEIDGERTEIDFLVIGKNGISIVEVKNSMRNVDINEEGKLYRVGEHTTFDSNLLYKMNVRKTMVKKILSNNGIAAPRIENIVVFTNEKISIHNECRDLKVCFLCQLRKVIENNRDMYYSQGQFDVIAETILENQYSGLYEVNINIVAFKKDLIDVLVKLESKKVVALTDVMSRTRLEISGMVTTVMNRIIRKRVISA